MAGWFNSAFLALFCWWLGSTLARAHDDVLIRTAKDAGELQVAVQSWSQIAIRGQIHHHPVFRGI